MTSTTLEGDNALRQPKTRTSTMPLKGGRLRRSQIMLLGSQKGTIGKHHQLERRVSADQKKERIEIGRDGGL